jgi:hemolysin III
VTAADARRAYSRAEVWSDAAIHVAGLAAAAGAVPVLIVLAALLRGDAASVAGASVYGVTLILMILCSALYHLVRRPGWGQVLLRLDHAAIFLKIAGTYTAFSLIAGEGYGLTAALWGAAAAGVALEVLMRRPRRGVSTALALGMGWAVLVGGGAILAALPTAAVVLMAVGGALYTAGAVFNHWRRLPFHNTIWHGFVLAATGVFYAAVVVAVVAA